MSKQGIKNLIGRAISSDEFRKQLIDDLENTIAMSGFLISEEEIDELKKLDFKKMEIQGFNNMHNSNITM